MAALDDEAVREAFERFYPELVGYFVKRGRSRERSRDLAQDTFLRVYEKRRLYRGEASVRTWMYNIAYRILLNDVRRGNAAMRRAETVPLLDEADPALAGGLVADGGTGGSPEALAYAAEQREILTEAIERLSHRARQCARLARSGLNLKQIGAALNIEENTVKFHMSKAREQLREFGHELEVRQGEAERD